MACHLIIPDAHAKPTVKNDRFEWLGRLIVDVKPDVVICLGDFADMYSLNSYEKGKASFHGASYREDIDSVLDAQKRMFAPIKRAKKKKPRFVMLGGNHDEARIARTLNSDPILKGTVGLGDLDYERYWEYHSFLDKVIIDGVVYSHYLKAGNSGNAMGGKHQANSMLMQEHCSVTVGHSHLLDYKTVPTGLGKRIHGLAAGCYFDHEESYAHPNDKNWWRGVIVKRNVNKGDYAPQFIPLADIKREYK